MVGYWVRPARGSDYGAPQAFTSIRSGTIDRQQHSTTADIEAGLTARLQPTVSLNEISGLGVRFPRGAPTRTSEDSTAIIRAGLDSNGETHRPALGARSVASAASGRVLGITCHLDLAAKPQRIGLPDTA
jgi:hypothetical protein